MDFSQVTEKEYLKLYKKLEKSLFTLRLPHGSVDNHEVIQVAIEIYLLKKTPVVRLKHCLIDAVRKVTGERSEDVYKRRMIQLQEWHSSSEDPNFAAVEAELDLYQIYYNKLFILTRNERFVFSQLLKEKSLTRIASYLRLTVSRVKQIKDELMRKLTDAISSAKKDEEVVNISGKKGKRRARLH
jgi:DNA-binding NarL/FixJ family response regulator